HDRADRGEDDQVPEKPHWPEGELRRKGAEEPLCHGTRRRKRHRATSTETRARQDRVQASANLLLGELTGSSGVPVRVPSREAGLPFSACQQAIPVLIHGREEGRADEAPQDRSKAAGRSATRMRSATRPGTVAPGQGV